MVEEEKKEARWEDDAKELIRPIFDKTKRRVTQRESWESKLATWYEMRHEGLRRKNKPGPWAADLHLPLADSQIDKHKPYYEQQTFNGERLAEFASLKSQYSRFAYANEVWFDFKLRHESNFTEEVRYNYDSFLLNGRSIMKVVWDADSSQLEFTSIDPAYVIVPESTTALSRATSLTHVIKITEEEYRMDGSYDQSEDLISRIKGSKGASGEEDTEREQEKSIREGITHSEDSDEILLWESWEREQDEDGRYLDNWIVYTYSPTCLEPVRKPYRPQLGHDFPPFQEFSLEIKDKGWYSPRGIPERVAPYETYGTKVWNEKADFITFGSRPAYTNDGDLSNTTNVNLRPGGVLPRGLKPVQPQMAPPDLAMELEFSKRTAEELLASPNFGISEDGGKERRTASEINYIGQLSSQGQDLKANVYRSFLGKLYKLAWFTLVEHADKNDLIVLYGGKEIEADPEGMVRDGFSISPSGSAEVWNKEQKMQRAFQRFQLFRGDPFINQLELRKDLIKAEDPRDVDRLIIDPKDRNADEREEQAKEIAAMLATKRPLNPREEDDHQAHLMEMLDFVGGFAMNGEKPHPGALQAIQQHYFGHVQALNATKQQDAANQFAQAWQATISEAAAFTDERQRIAQEEQAMMQGGMS